MKKLILALCAILVLGCCAAAAESAPEKIILWEHTAKEIDEAGNVIEQQFLAIGNWNFGSALSVLMMVLILLSMVGLSRYDKDGSGGYFL